MRKAILPVLLLLLISALPVRAGSVNLQENATYSHGNVIFTCELGNVTGFYRLDVFANGRHVYMTSGSVSRTDEPIRVTVSFRLKNALPDEFMPLPDVAFSGVKLPVAVYLTEYNDSGVAGRVEAQGTLSVAFGPTAYFPLLWAVLVFLTFFAAPIFRYTGGWDFATDVLGLQFIFRSGGLGWVTGLIVMPFMSRDAITGGKPGHSIIVLGGLAALLLLQSAYSLGFTLAEYPKIAFYTGLEWTAGIPLAFYFLWPGGYALSLIYGFLLMLPLFIVLWKYAELPYSKCSRALSFFRTYSILLGTGIALILAFPYVTGETMSLFVFLLISLFLYLYTSRLAFGALERAKKRFDENLERIRSGGGVPL